MPYIAQEAPLTLDRGFCRGLSLNLKIVCGKEKYFRFFVRELKTVFLTN